MDNKKPFSMTFDENGLHVELHLSRSEAVKLLDALIKKSGGNITLSGVALTQIVSTLSTLGLAMPANLDKKKRAVKTIKNEVSGEPKKARFGELNPLRSQAKKMGIKDYQKLNLAELRDAIAQEAELS